MRNEQLIFVAMQKSHDLKPKKGIYSQEWAEKLGAPVIF